MKQPSDIAEEICKQFADGHLHSESEYQRELRLRNIIAAAIQARDEAHTAEVERLKADVKRISDVRDELMDNLTYWRDSHRGLQAELESARAVMTTIADMTLHSKLGGAGPSVRIAQTCGSMARKWLERQGK
jgi:hypothetical protein